MESDSGMKELIQSMIAMNVEDRTIKADPFSGKQEDYLNKWRLKQKQLFILASMAHALEPTFNGKLPSSETMELDESNPDGKQFASIGNRMQKLQQS